MNRLHLIFSIVSSVLYSCATVRYPVTHLESPETLGAVGLGRLEITNIMTGVDMTSAPEQRYNYDAEGNQTTSYYQAQPTVLAGPGFVVRISDTLEAGVRFMPSSPLSVRLKMQIAGEPESSAAKNNFSASMVFAPGIMLSGNTSVYSVDFALPAGYRVWRDHLFSITPFFSTASISNAATTATQNLATSVSLLQFGASLGYQYTVENLFVRAEAAYSSGSMAETKAGGLYFGSVLGLNFY